MKNIQTNEEKTLKIFSTEVSDVKIEVHPVLLSTKKELLFPCLDFYLKVTEIQLEGKKRMKQIGSVEIPQRAFLSILKLDDE